MPHIKPASLLFLASAVVAVATYWFVFELRYAWFLHPDQARFLGIVLLVVAAGLVALWLWYPSRLLTAIVSAVGVALPPLAMGNVFPPLDRDFAPFAIGAIALCVLATHFRRRAFVGPSHAL